MLPLRTFEQVVESLKQKGIRFHNLVITTEGNYEPADVDWNYRDILHMKCVHAVDLLLLGGSGDSFSAIWHKSFFGVTFPMLVYSYRLSETKHSGITVCFGFVLVSEDTFESISPNRTKVTTRYGVGAPKWLGWILPWLARWIHRQSLKLGAEDKVMRERRGQLREQGYGFRGDRLGYDFQSGNSRTEDNVILPNRKSVPRFISSLEELFEHQNEFFFGDQNHHGLRFFLKQERLLVFRRMCLHEGAGLDSQDCQGGKIACPWHGRSHSPIGEFDLRVWDEQRLRIEGYQVSIKNRSLIIENESLAGAKEVDVPSSSKSNFPDRMSQSKLTNSSGPYSKDL